MIPIWACKEYGQYEHDWLDCPDCISEYERYLEDPEKYEETEYGVDPGINIDIAVDTN